MEPIKSIIVHGSKEIADKETPEVTVYRLASATRGDSNKYNIDIENNQIQLEFDDDSTWMIDSSTIHEVFPEMDPAIPSLKNRDGGVINLDSTTSIESSDSERGIIGKIALRLIRVFAKKAITGSIDALAKKLEDAHLMNGVLEDIPNLSKTEQNQFLEDGARVFRLSKNFTFKNFSPKKASKIPYLLFIHGTNSDTKGAFLDLYKSQLWDTLVDRYSNNIIAFQHRTLTESPLENAVKLSSILPDNAVLHIISHSRGGLVGDILSKYSGDDLTKRPFSKDNINLLLEEGDKERKDDVSQIKALNKLFESKEITIEKFIRVASPGAGTTLASKRLDNILNVFSNLLGGVFLDLLVDLLRAAIKTKNNVNVLPGLEAMDPDSPFIKILNDPIGHAAIDGKSLMVISGNGEFSLSKKGFLIILGRLFYWRRNDLVVNTDSMYLGAKRNTKIQYYFSHGPGVDHVTYFENKQTQEAIEYAITTKIGDSIPGFTSVNQYEIPSSDRALLEYGELYPNPELPKGNKPIVVLLPGIMGSNLENEEDKELWLHYGRILTGGLTKLKYEASNKITPSSVVKTSYFDLFERLSSVYDVIIYPFDWRKPLTESAAEFNEKIKELLAFEQPIKIIGHSMGGVLVRDFIIGHYETWKTLNARDNFKLIYLGSPLGGSHRILAVLFGKDGIINKLNMLDRLHSKRRLLKMFSKFPGILGLLPLTTHEGEDYADEQTWIKMLDVFGKKKWPLPSLKDLNDFKAYRDNIIEKQKKLDIDYSNMIYIAGKDKMTPNGYYLDEKSSKLYFLYTSEGDQSVTWKLGIPQQLKDLDAVYYTRVSHGALANDSSIFKGIEELLLNGKTDLLSKSQPISREETKIFRAEPPTDFDLSAEGLRNTIFGNNYTSRDTESKLPIKVTVSNGDLLYASHPLLAGHFLNDAILYAERAIDNCCNGALSHKHNLGLYPGEIGTNEIFVKVPENDYKGAIIIGMGIPDKLTSRELSKSIEQGTLNYILSKKGPGNRNKGLGISALVMASDYGGLTMESSIKAIINGVNQANDKIRILNSTEYSFITDLEFIERYVNRALNCMYILNDMIWNKNMNFNIVLGDKKIKDLLGIRKRIPMDSRDDWWHRITVKYKKGNPKNNKLSSMVFGASSNDSREEENRLYSSTPLIDLFIKEISVDNLWSPCTAKTLFELLIPNPLKDKLKRKGNISWILDENSAAYPWELLQHNVTNAKPICIDAGMIRQLSTSNYRKDIKRAVEKRALVIADPNLDDFISQLPGAKKEGLEVQEVLKQYNYPTTSLIGRDASDIMTAFFCNDYSIIHLAGHGVYNAENPKQSGMVIGKELFLSVFEIEQLPIVPEIVFVNCCHIGATKAADEKYYRDRYKLAANIGTQLIKIGVKVVIAAGWAVQDSAARKFAEVFYERMFNGNNFGQSVKDARGEIYEPNSKNNTWGAYQCYGDPFYKLKNVTKYSKWNPRYIVPQEAEIHLDNLFNDIEMGLGKRKQNNYLEELDTIIKSVLRDVTETAVIIEKQARIYLELAKYDKAIEKYELLLQEENANFTFSAMETYCGARAKLSIKKVYEKHLINNRIKTKEFNEIESVIKDLNLLLNIGKTPKRLSLMASTLKKQSLLSRDSKTSNQKLLLAMKNYNESFVTVRKNYDNLDEINSVYPLVNSLQLFYILKKRKAISSKKEFIIPEKEVEIKDEAKARAILSKIATKISDTKNNNSMDYWHLLASLQIELCLLISSQLKNEKRWERLIEDYKVIWRKVGSEGKKLSELEHLKFLIYSLKNNKEKVDLSPLDFKEESTIEDLINHINLLKKVLGK